VLGWVDHPDHYGPLTNPQDFEKPEYLTSAVVLTKWPQALEYAVRGWSKFGTLKIIEAIYAYIKQMERGLLNRKELAFKILEILPQATELDILAIQRVLKLGLGVTTCDLGLVVLSRVAIRDAPPPPPPKGVIYELKRGDLVLYISRNNNGPVVYDGETMCIIPMSSREPLHPLYKAYLDNYKIVTEGAPSPGDLCVIHRKIRLDCISLTGLW